MTIRAGVLVATSVTEVGTADEAQYGGCLRRWWFERAMDLRDDQNRKQEEGVAGHAHLAHYFLTGERPRGRKLMGKAVTGAIVKGELPKPGPDLLVEERFDGQPKQGPGGEWLPVDAANTLVLAGVPFDGFIDLAFRRGEVPEVWDHKFFTPARPEIDPDPYAFLKKGDELIRTVQMPVYAASQIPYWPDATHWRLVHHYVSKRGVDSLIRSAVVTTEQVLERVADVTKVVERMKAYANAENQSDVPFNRRACNAWLGCPRQSICQAYRGNLTMPAELTDAERDLFPEDMFPAPESAPALAPGPAPAPAPTVRKGAANIVGVVEPAALGAVPAPTPAAPEPWSSVCACGETVTAENGSKLHNRVVHIGCKLTAPRPAEAKAPRARRAKAAPAPAQAPAPAPAQTPATTPAPAPAAFLGERQSDRDASAALEAIKAARAETAAPAPAPAPEVVPQAVPWPRAPRAAPSPREALAAIFENLAFLVRHT